MKIHKNVKSFDPSKSPQIRSAFECLKNKSLIFPGSVIAKEIVEEALSLKYEDSWKFQGPYISLQAEISKCGYFVTTRGLDAPSFRILKSCEMHDEACRRVAQAMFENMKTGYIMAAHDTSSLSEDQKKKHEWIQMKAAESAMMQQKLLMKDRFF